MKNMKNEKQETGNFEIHPDKIKVLTNQKSNRLKEIEIDGIFEEVKYLVQMITFMDRETTEVQRRILCAWSAFARHRQEMASNS